VDGLFAKPPVRRATGLKMSRVGALKTFGEETKKISSQWASLGGVPCHGLGGRRNHHIAKPNLYVVLRKKTAGECCLLTSTWVVGNRPKQQGWKGKLEVKAHTQPKQKKKQ